MRIHDALPDLSSIKRLNQRSDCPDNVSGQPIMIIFWSVNCSSCNLLIQRLKQVKEIKAGQVVPILIHTYLDKADVSEADIRKKLEQLSLDAIYLNDLYDELTDVFQFHYVPALYLFDRNGRMRFRQIGKTVTNLVEKRLKRIIAER